MPLQFDCKDNIIQLTPILPKYGYTGNAFNMTCDGFISLHILPKFGLSKKGKT